MYTDEQLQEALRKKQFADIEKSLNWQWHLHCISDVSVYNLPYRILWDNYHNHNKPAFEIDINPWYPLPAIPKQALLSEEEQTPAIRKQYTDSEWLGIITTKGRGQANPIMINELYPQDEAIARIWEQQKAEIKAKAEAKAKPYKLWWLDDSEGIKKWEYYFVRFLVPYKDKLASWGKFDFWGNNEHTDEETEKKRQYYLSLIADYEVNPSKYDTKPHYEQLSDYDTYEVNAHGLGYMWHDNFEDTPPAHPQALQIMYKEREQEKQRYIDSGIEYKLKHIDRYSRLARINRIIDKLEQEQGKGDTIA